MAKKKKATKKKKKRKKLLRRKRKDTNMAKEIGSTNKSKGVDFGRGTMNIKGEDYTKILEGQVPVIKGDEGKPDITDKTS